MNSLSSFIVIVFLSLDAAYANSSCSEKTEMVIVNGDSMSPLLKSGQELKVDKNYYACKAPHRGDIIIFEIAGRKNQVIKKIFGIAGDKFEYKDKKILINGKPLQNSAKQAYEIDSKMLKLYADSYPVIPENSYLVLGDNSSGSFDASRFGFIDRKQIVGRVILQSKFSPNSQP